MAELDFRLLLVLLLGCTLCLSVTADVESEETGPANPQVAGGDGGSKDEGANDDDVTDPGEIEEANKYLSQYGYYDDDDNRPTQRSGSNVERAIALLQYKAHIPVTGRLNRETIAMMRQPRCGNKDFNGPSDRLRRRRRRYSLSGNSWSKKDLTYKFINYTPDLGQRTTRAEIVRAFNLWSRAANINFREVRQGRADIDLRFAYGSHGDGYEFDGRGGVLAHAFFPGPQAISGDAHFDEIERFTSNSRDGTNLFMVAAHELGHSLGLGHSDVENSMMAPIYQGYRHGIQLHRDDIMAIQRLYGRRRGAPPTTPTRPPSGPVVPQPPNRPSVPTTPTCNIRVSALLSTSANDLLAFSNNQYWRIAYDGQSYSVARGYPQQFSNRFKAFSGGSRRTPLTAVDAAYKRTDGSLRFFKGTEFFDFSAGGSLLQQGNIISLFRRRQRQRAPSSIDAAVLVPNANNMVYLFKGTQYWRLNDEDSRVDPGYPQPLTKWSPELATGRIDGAFFATDSVFFISGNNYRRFMWDGYSLEPGSFQFDRKFFGCGRLQDGSIYNSAGNGQASSRTIRNWALVPGMLAVSIAARHLILH
ncbi:matrix metalloproteinase-16-like [Patiria miniata]|uniref:Peptidase metallopeptidase domain-containing protein n=1 Tax=Patiria miniata TaxID=46514 RepID=A0A913ZY34_PATMI|nr:matrix metalloproteinase-16-like [Patiria miniata]